MPEVYEGLTAAFDELDKKTPSDAPDLWRRGHELWRSDGEHRRWIATNALTLYHGHARHTFGGGTMLMPESSMTPPGYNLIQAAVDTKTAHIVRNQVRPMFVTERGDSQLRKKALGMQRAVEAVFIKTGIWGELGESVCRDGSLFEAGGVKIFPDYNNSTIRAERVFAHDVLVDPGEAELGSPRQKWHVCRVDRRVLLKRYADNPTALKAIQDAPSLPYDMANHEDLRGRSDVADRVLVLEYWRLPAGTVDTSRREVFGRNDEGELDDQIDPGHDGRHVVCLENAALFEEPWPFDYFPFAWFKPMKNAVGYWSRSVPETLAGAQLEINEIQERIREILRLHAVPRIFAWKQARLDRAKFTNDVGSVITTAVPPSQAVYVPQWNTVPSELFNRIEMLIRWAEKQIGLSEMSIAGIKPKGVDHAPGMQHLQDTETLRHTPDFRAWERFHVDAARIIVDCCRMLAQFGGLDLQIAWGDSKQMRRIDWSEVDLPSERYHLRCWPTNMLPLTPGARKSFVIDLMNAGLFTPEQAKAALDFPDVEAIFGDQTAAREFIEVELERAVSGAPFAIPQPYMDLNQAVQMSLDLINRMGADGEDEARIDRVRRWWEEALKLRDAAMPMAPPGGDPMAPPPPGAPMPPEPAAA